ncbi:MAG: pantetheine-phosphate adenylyltransferase [Chloroflexota bacterium]
MIRAIFPASFDPITNGHLDIATRASRLFDELTLAVFDRPAKSLLFSLEERVGMAAAATAHLRNVRVDSYGGELTVDYARRKGAKVLVRGLRAASDFEGEFQMGHANRQLAPDIETICLMSAPEWSFISSSIIKEIARLGGNVAGFVPPAVLPALLARAGA